MGMEVILMTNGETHGLAATPLAGLAERRDLKALVEGGTDVSLTHTLLTLTPHTAVLVRLVAFGALVGTHWHGAGHGGDTFMLEVSAGHGVTVR